MIKKILSFFILLFITINIYTQTPFIRNFSPEAYKASGQNWAIVQNNQGIMYFANNIGVLEYDGTNWRVISTPRRARSLCIDSMGVIYVGLETDFGYLQSDSTGRLHYISLKDKIPKEHQDVNQIWNIYTLGSKIIFVATHKLFILQNNRIDVLLIDNGFRNDFVLNDRFYIEKKKGGLYLLENDSLLPLPGNEDLYTKYIMALLPYENEDILMATLRKGIYIYNPNKSPFLRKPKGFEAVDNFLIKNQAYTGIMLNNGHFAFGSRKEGIIVFDKLGKIHNHYNKENGLQSNTPYYLFTDLNGQLWAALQNGISLIMNNLPFSYYTDKNGLDGSVYCIQKFKNKLYVGTSNNLYVQNTENNFERIEGTTGQNFFLLPANEKLLLGNCPKGIFEINDNQALQQSSALKNAPSTVAITLRKHPNYIITQVWDQGLALIEYKNTKWIFRHIIKGFDKNARYIEEDNKENIWINANNELYKLRLNESLDSVILTQEFKGEKYHLPESFIMPYRLNNGDIIFSSEKGIFRYLPDKDNFEEHPDFPMISRFVFPFKQDKNGNIWFEEIADGNIAEKGIMRPINGTYEINKTPFLKFTESTVPNDCSLYPYTDSLVYFGTNKGLLEYHPKQIVNYDIPFNTLIREIFVTDSLFYGGAATDSLSISDDPLILKYKDNNLFFHYSATFFEDSDKNLFSYRLIGSSDTTWSVWTNDHKKEYTNLQEGKYIFEVKSQNIYRKQGNIASYTFEILPPWHRTWLAYILYGLLATGFVIIIIRLNSARLKKHNELLKQIVNKRTADLSNQKEKLQIQAEELKANNEKLRLLNATKDKFFTLISHDLRSPFNSILGFTNLLVEEYNDLDDAQKKKIINSLNKSSKSAYELLENLLTWAQTQTGRMEINKELLNLKELIETSIAVYRYNAFKKNIEIAINIPSNTKLSIDRNTSITIIGNLVNNAIKFTPDGGTITINYIENENNIELHIIDTGVGMSAEVIGKLFKIDEDISTKGTNNENGTGLGLILCKEFINKNGGDISVISEEGKGSEFILTIPK